MNQPDSIQKSRPGLRREVLPGSRLRFGFRSPEGQWETSREPAASPEDRPGRTAWAAELPGSALGGRGGRGGVGPRGSDSLSVPDLRAPPDLGGRVPSPAGAGAGGGWQCRMAEIGAPSLGVRRGPTRKLKASLGQLRSKREGGGV